jgi:hypothetical protein
MTSAYVCGVCYVTPAVHVWLCVVLQTKPRAEKRRKRDEEDEEVSLSSRVYVLSCICSLVHGLRK